MKKTETNETTVAKRKDTKKQETWIRFSKKDLGQKRFDYMSIIIIASMLAALSILLELLPLKIRTPWGMSIDFVAVVWIIAVMLFGLRCGLITSVISSIFIAFISNASLLGATMKFTATLPLILAIGIVRYYVRAPRMRNMYYLVAIIIAVIIRCFVMVYFNYAFALRIWFPEMTIEQIMQAYPSWMIIVPNIIQSAVDFCLAWLLVFMTKLRLRIK
jgi:riboflavin transporter FmnP